MRNLSRSIAHVLTAGALLAVLAGCTSIALTIEAPPALHTSPVPAHTVDAYIPPSLVAVDELPEATYAAVIPGLIANQGITAAAPTVYSLSADTALYSADRTTPIAHLAALNFLGDRTVVVPIQQDGGWSLVLTPSRLELPSTVNGSAPAQSSAWLRTDALVDPISTPDRIQVSVENQQLIVLDRAGQPVSRYPVGVGTPGTPTPTSVTGYIQARYLDPAQGQTEYPIQLTSLHSAAADEPYGGSDGGLIGVHYEEENTGQVSHGCVRLPVDAITAVNSLPLGTLITII
ncbi:L,D-transpeptidase [Subtercola vilae]|uniref:Murein L,D-transpeptidase n=1 Tax=Subtercola vilae TaxID=2056433 RepID=A0A4T2BGB7_9MICO|nr:L,D-transpeptidase [Subtercola vilae]TIH28781.1 murein L,D-transpeptidase [Subtercola vilae]